MELQVGIPEGSQTRHAQVLVGRVALAIGYRVVVVALDAGRRRGSDDLDDRYKCKHREQLGQHARHPRAPTAATMALERKCTCRAARRHAPQRQPDIAS